MKNILLIEDMEGVRESLAFILSTKGHEVHTAVDGEEGISKLGDVKYDLVITDIIMPKVDGSDVIMDIERRGLETPVLAISAGGNGVSADQALALAKEKATAILEKPFSKDEFLAKVEEMLGEV